MIKGEKEKYNNKKARYIAALVMQNSRNKNLGISYETAVKNNYSIKGAVDYWIEKMTYSLSL